MLPPPIQLRQSSLQLHRASSSLRLNLGQLSLYHCHGFTDLRLCLVPQPLWLCRASHSLQLHLSPQAHRLCLSLPAPWFSLGCSCPQFCLGLQDLLCHPLSSALPESPPPSASSQSVVPLVLPAQPPPWFLDSTVGLHPGILAGGSALAPPIPLTPPWLLPRHLLPGCSCCLLHPGSSGHPLYLLCVPYLSPILPSFVGLFVIFMVIVNKVMPS